VRRQFFRASEFDPIATILAERQKESPAWAGALGRGSGSSASFGGVVTTPWSVETISRRCNGRQLNSRPSNVAQVLQNLKSFTKAVVTYIAGRLLYTDKTTAQQYRSRGGWKDFESAKTADHALTSSDWEPAKVLPKVSRTPQPVGALGHLRSRQGRLFFGITGTEPTYEIVVTMVFPGCNYRV
jgi:hypothetical protein